MAQFQVAADAVSGIAGDLKLHIIVTRRDTSPSAGTETRQTLFEQTIDLSVTIASPQARIKHVNTSQQLAITEGIQGRTSRRTTFDFFRLPLELRDKIYNCLLPQRLSHQDGSFLEQSPHGILLANKQAYKEFCYMLKVNATYRLIFSACAPNCACHLKRRRERDFDLEAAKQEPDASAEIVVHSHTVPIVLAKAHVSALSWFSRLEIVLDMSETSSTNSGVANIPQIVGVIGPSLLRALPKGSKEHVHLTIRWLYKSSITGADKYTHLDRLQDWEKALKSLKLTARSQDRTFSRREDVYRLTVEIKIGRKSQY